MIKVIETIRSSLEVRGGRPGAYGLEEHRLAETVIAQTVEACLDDHGFVGHRDRSSRSWLPTNDMLDMLRGEVGCTLYY